MKPADILGFKPYLCYHCGAGVDEGEIHVCTAPRWWGYGLLGSMNMPLEVAQPAPRVESPVVLLALLGI